MGIIELLNKNTNNQINNSELSNKVQPIFMDAFSICKEFGFERQSFEWNYRNKIIDICCCISKDSLKAFDIGTQVIITFKSREVFNCIIKKNGRIDLKKNESGDWQEYFNVLKKRVATTLAARNLLSTLYEFGGNHLYAIGRDRKVPGAKAEGYSFNNGRISITYNLYPYDNWIFTDNRIKVKFDRNEKKNVASSAIITFMGETVFDAVHFFPSRQRPFSSNTKCKLYKKGNWEKHLTDAINNVKTIYGV